MAAQNRRGAKWRRKIDTAVNQHAAKPTRR
jgi:hypothetical protein